MQRLVELIARASICSIAIAVLLAYCSWAVVRFIDLPVVEHSYTTKECVRVVLPNGSEGKCQELPSKYRMAWVQ